MPKTPAAAPAVAGPAAVRLYYVDDSGAHDTGYVVYAWIELGIQHWRGVLRHWLDMRKQMYANYKIPPAAELHATKLVGGRGEPSTDPRVNASKWERRRVVQVALQTIGSTPGLRVGTIYRVTTATGRGYARERDEVYRRLVDHLDTRLGAAGELGMIFMDGDGTAGGYYNAHRGMKLAYRSIVEDPLFQCSGRSQLVQMADLVAWTSYQALLRHPGKRYAWDWYDAHLRASDINGGPVSC
ncbi:DUF3800 domain-containing protein [Actinomadura sp. 6N118]|uniref:DUF3800 domain-containing protein n=1 Tax=Actinomadura sp. 6N118 TaxID=3375151 RepID=UPI0037AAAB72